MLAAARGRYGAAVPVLVLSAVADAEEARDAGADGCVRKPNAVENLVAAIQQLLAA